MSSKAYRRYAAMIQAGTVGESFIRGFRSALHAMHRRESGYSVGATAAILSLEEAGELWGMITDIQPRIAIGQESKGYSWLCSKRVYRALGTRERFIVNDFSHFTLDGFWNASESELPFFVPVYRVHARDGRTFSYYTGSWQSGIPLTVIG